MQDFKDIPPPRLIYNAMFYEGRPHVRFEDEEGEEG